MCHHANVAQAGALYQSWNRGVMQFGDCADYLCAQLRDSEYRAGVLNTQKLA